MCRDRGAIRRRLRPATARPHRLLRRDTEKWSKFKPSRPGSREGALLGGHQPSVKSEICGATFAARTIGFRRPAILFREILPNVMPVLIALLTLEMGIAVVVEAILSFVGLSVSSDTPTWGGMIAEGRQIVHEGWWVLAAPLAALFATVVAFNQLGDGLARSLDPVLRR